VKLLLDHNIPKRFRQYLAPHEVKTTRQIHCEFLNNGKLIRRASESGFDVFLTCDKRIEFEQNLKSLPLPVVVMDSGHTRLASLVQFAPYILELMRKPMMKILYVVLADGLILELTEPRRERP